MSKKVLAIVILFVVVLIVLLIVLANSRSNSTGGGNTPTPTTSGSVKLIWWNLFEPQANVQPLIDAFQTAHPNIQIQYVQEGLNGTNDYRTGLDTNLNDQDISNTPDIFAMQNSWTQHYVSLISPAASSIISQDDINAFYPTVSNDFYLNKKTYGLPLYLDTIAIIYNKKLLAAKGYTTPANAWTDFEVQAANLTVTNKGAVTQGGFSAFYPKNSEFYFEVLNNILMSEGMQILDNNGVAKLTGQKEAEDAVGFYQKFITSNQTWDANMDKDIAAFLEGKLAMYAAPSWRLMNVLAYNQKYNLGLDVGVATMPQIYQTTEVYYPSYWGLTVSKDCQHPNEAWDFIKFMTQEAQLSLLNDTVKANGRTLGIIYPRTSMASLNQADPYLGPYAISLAKANLWPMKDGYALKQKFDLLFQTGTISTSSLEGAINSVQSSK